MFYDVVIVFREIIDGKTREYDMRWDGYSLSGTEALAAVAKHVSHKRKALVSATVTMSHPRPLGVPESDPVCVCGHSANNHDGEGRCFITFCSCGEYYKRK